jgi:hypothetical protein
MRFLVWICGRRRRIDPTRICELSDFDLPEWQELLQRDLAHISSRRFPGLIEPLVAKLVEMIGSKPVEHGMTTVASIGCGAMEAESQLMHRLAPAEHLRVMGCDNSSTAFASASANLATGGHSLTAIPETGVDGLPPGLYLHQGDAFEFLAAQPDSSFDLLFHARFRHHLPRQERAAFDSECARVAHVVIEYDDYQCLTSLLGPLLTAWRRPVLLNGAILSWVRGRTQTSLRAEYGVAVTFHNPPGTYLRLMDRTAG